MIDVASLRKDQFVQKIHVRVSSVANPKEIIRLEQELRQYVMTIPDSYQTESLVEQPQKLLQLIQDTARIQGYRDRTLKIRFHLKDLSRKLERLWLAARAWAEQLDGFSKLRSEEQRKAILAAIFSSLDDRRRTVHHLLDMTDYVLANVDQALWSIRDIRTVAELFYGKLDSARLQSTRRHV